MSGWFPALAVPMLLAASASVLPAEAAAQPDAAHARAVAEHWLDGLGRRGLVLNETMKHGGFEVSHSEGLQGLITRFQLRQPGWSLLIAFDGELSTTTPLRTLRNSFRYAALDRLPTPGLEIPGWEVWPRTPTSSFGEGVEILAYGNGRIRLRVRTSFFALYGRDPSVLVPADSRAPAGSFFQIRRSIPLDLTIDAAVTFL